MSTPSFPEWLEPMAATLTHEPFSGPEWIFERKLDGIRLLAFKNGSEVRCCHAIAAAASPRESPPPSGTSRHRR
jgi:hypothetical protein